MSRETAYTAHLPRFVLARLQRDAPGALCGRPDPRRAATMFCDISGFTPLSETLARQGKPGTEELTVQLNDYFERLLGVVGSWGGDTVKFGGDAVTVLFEAAEGEEMEGPLRRAAAAAREVFEVLGVVRTARTAWGDFPLSLKIGISAGTVLTGIIGSGEERTEPVVAGDALDRMAEAEHHARPGDIVVDLQAEGAASSGFGAEDLGGGFGRLLGLSGHVPKPVGAAVPVPPPDRVRPFLLPAVWGQIEAGSEAMLGEHRAVVTAFVAFPGLDYSDPESLPHLDDYFRRVHASLKGFGGSFNRMDMGDKGSKFLCFFGAPESYEDNAERAVAFALALRELERDVPWAQGQRVGLSLGTNFCGMMGSQGRREYTVMGDAVNVAARLMGAAKPSEALAMGEIRTGTRTRFQWGPYRSLALKGKSAPIQVSSPKGVIRRAQAQTPKAPVSLVGRTAEFALLRKAMDRAGRGPLPFVVLRGEAGIGKTALLNAALAEAAGSGWRTALGVCQSVGSAPLQAWLEIFRALLTGGRGDREAIETRLRDLLPDQREYLGLALRFLGFAAPLSPSAESLAPKERLEKTTDLLARSLRALSRESPVVVALDGLSHADQATKDLLSVLLPSLHGARVAVFGASRPGLDLPVAAKDIHLEGLGSEEARALASRILDAPRITDGLAEFLLGRTGGNPLFLMELLQNLRERGAVGKDREGAVQFHPTQVGETPGSIEGLLLARIDRLPLVTRNVLKVAACLGTSFDLPLLQSVFLPRMAAPELEGHLRALETLGLAPVETEEGAGFTFLHSSLRESAYNAVLLANRRSIHRSAAECLEVRGPGADPSLVAYHFGQAEVWDKALLFGLEAGFAAWDRFALNEAAALFDQVEMWSRRSGLEVPVAERVKIADCFLQAGNGRRAGEVLEVLFSGELTPSDRLSALEAKLRLLESRDLHAEVITLSEELRAEATALGRTDLVLKARRCSASSLFRTARFQDALRVLAEARAELGGSGDEESATLDVLEAAVLFQRGEFASATVRYGAAYEWATQNEHMPIQIRTAMGLSNAARGMGDFEKSLEFSRRAYDLALRAGSRFNVLGATVICTSALNALGRYQEASDLLEENLQLAAQEDFPYASCSYFNEMGVTRYFQKRYADAIRYYRRVGRIARKIGSAQQRAFSEHNIAETLREMGQLDQARRGYPKALSAWRRCQNPPMFVSAAKDFLAMAAQMGGGEVLVQAQQTVRRELKLWKREDLMATILAH